MNPRIVVFQKAWPIIIANAATPLLGLADTAIIGQTGSTQALGALAISNLLFNFLYWAFGFLRMSTTGFVSQAQGSGDTHAITSHTLRALFIAVFVACTLVASQLLILKAALALFQASDAVETIASTYFQIRIWGAPATLTTFVISGLLIGLGKSRYLLLMQGSLNALNIGLDLLFAGVFEWGVKGIAFGTLLTEYLVAITSLLLLFKARPVDVKFSKSIKSVFNSVEIIKAVSTNRDLFLRTFFLLLSFAFFTNQGAGFSDTTLAANHLLLQFISFSAFFMDGFAFVAESQVGQAIGRHKQKLFYQAVRFTSEWAFASALVLASTIFLFADPLIDLLTNIPDVQNVAHDLAPLACLYILLSIAAFQLDGIFIGATQAKAMRNASIISFIGFMISWYIIGIHYGNTGLWLCFIAYVCLRAITLATAWKHVACMVKAR